MIPTVVPWHRLRFLSLLTLACFLSVPRLSVATELSPPAGFSAPSQPTAFPAFELPDAQGATTRSADLQGKVVVVRFWATW